jgi:predicted transcriptional regulator
MEIVGLLEGDDALSVADIQSRLKKSGNELAYTTVMTVLTRLHDKGVLTRKKDGRQFLYQRAKGAARVGDKLLSTLKRTLFKKERLRPILALLADDDLLTDDELKELRRAVDERLKKSSERA